MGKMQQCWLLLLFLLTWVTTGQSLVCYECPMKGMCGEGEMGNTRTCNNGKKTVCIKIQEMAAQGQNVSRVMRMCGNHDYNNGADTCQNTRAEMTGSVVDATVCTCDTDLCNKAPKSPAPLIIIFSFVLFNFIKFWL